MKFINTLGIKIDREEKEDNTINSNPTKFKTTLFNINSQLEHKTPRIRKESKIKIKWYKLILPLNISVIVKQEKIKISTLKKFINDKLNIISVIKILDNSKRFLKINPSRPGRQLSSTSLKLSPLDDKNLKTTLCHNIQMSTEINAINNQGEQKKITLDESDAKFNM